MAASEEGKSPPKGKECPFDVNTPEWLDWKYGPKVQVDGETITLKDGTVAPVYRRTGKVAG